MCGIAGCVTPAGERPDRGALERMTRALHHRGPDDLGIEVHDNVGLVSTRLAIVDPGPAGHQPMWDASKRWLLAYNGEVYNHRELRAELPGGAWRGHSDTETLVAALEAWGDRAVERCNGPLAVAAVDRADRRLLLARDRFGKKPLYIAWHRGAMWFASEIGALLAAGVPARARPDVLAHTVARGWAYGRATPLEGIERMRPGTLVSVGLETLGVSERRWYDPAWSVDHELAQELESLPRSELADRLEEAIRTAVRRRLLADVPLGTMCSGGLDSSLVTALARDEGGPVAAFNCSLVDEPEADEARWAERAAEALGVELQTVVLGAAEWRAALVAAVRAHEYPPASMSSVPISVIAGLARSRGVKVLLTGEGADELFAGYPLLHARPELGFLPARVVAWRYGLAFARRRLKVVPLLRGMGVWRPYPTVEGPAAVEAERGMVEAAAARAYAHHQGTRARYEAALLAALTCSDFPFLLNRMDKDAMAASIETRVPFLDPDVVALALNLPLEARTVPRLKGVLRDVGRRHLPAAIVKRHKYPGMAFDARRRIEEAARPEFLRDGLVRDILRLSDERWRELLAEASARTVVRLWSAEIWTRLFVERHGVERVEEELWAPGRMERRAAEPTPAVAAGQAS